MTEFKPAAALREFDRLAARDDTPQALAWLRTMRPRFMTQTDALLRAKFMLRAGGLRDSAQPMRQLIDELMLAIGIFRAHGQAADAAHGLARLAYWYHRKGLLMPALLCGRQALAARELPSAERTRLQVLLVGGLAAQRLMADAWAMLAEVEAHRLPQPEAWMLTASRASLHLVEAVRARRLASAFTLDLPPGQAPDLASAEHHLDACERLLADLPPRARGLEVPVYVLSSCHALRGDRTAALAPFAARREATRSPDGRLSHAVALYNEGWCLRVLGDGAQAAVRLHEALDLLAKQPTSRLQSMVCLDLAECARQQGDAAQALHWMDHTVHRLTVLRSMEHEAMAVLAKLLDAPAVASGATDRAAALVQPVAAPPAPAQEGEPAVLAHAEALFVSRLPRRMPLPTLAAELGVSIRTLQLTARRYRQCTLGEMLRAQVMLRARALLRESGLSIAEVAAALGYQDASSLSRDVRRHFGCTPRTLRAGLSARPEPEVCPPQERGRGR